MRVILLLLYCILVACNELPRDAAHTSERVTATGNLRVTIVSGTKDPAPALGHAERLAGDWSAVVTTNEKPAAIALQDLDNRATDLVIGEFGRSSAVSKEASLSQAIGQPEPKNGRIPTLRFARKKGENRLITQTDMMVMQ